VDDLGSGDARTESDAPRPKSAGVWRSVLLSFAAAGLFATLLTSYLLKTTKLPDAPLLVATSDAVARKPDTLEIAQRVASAFVVALRAGDTAGAYAQMAQPYRESASLASFRNAWRTPLLASPRVVKLTRASEGAVQIDGAYVRGATFTARGMLVAAAGALDTSFTFLREADDTHVLAVFVGGVPIVQGLGPSAPTLQ
jgi:hypothetical protein